MANLTPLEKKLGKASNMNAKADSNANAKANAIINTNTPSSPHAFSGDLQLIAQLNHGGPRLKHSGMTELSK